MLKKDIIQAVQGFFNTQGWIYGIKSIGSSKNGYIRPGNLEWRL